MSSRAEPDPARVAALFDTLVELPPDELPARLDALCAGDAALREVVARLLAHDRDAAPGFLARPFAIADAALREQAALATTVPRDDAAADLPPSPERLGRFTVLGKLGEGGMGAVYVGYDDVLDRHVALKLLHRGAEARAWLRREGQALARLAHPNVVGIHELGEHGGRVFLAMELVPGPTLRVLLEERRPPFTEVLRLLLEAGRGLAAAHEAGLVHRDFKPDNVLVGADGRARVVDFGLATLAELAAAPDPAGPPPDKGSALGSPLTRSGALVGTPAFMSPEQLRGERATSQSDQFSFCVALYRAAYGAAPFPAGDLDELARSLARGSPARAPPRPEVPRWLEPILRRGLAADPGARFPSLPALLAEIERRLPRDPGLDPSLVRREVQILRAALFVLGVVLFAFASRHPELLTPRRMVNQSVVVVVVAALTVLLRFRRLAANRFGQRAAGLFLGITLTVLGHRLVALRLGMSLPHMMVEDMVVLTASLSVAAVTVDRQLVVLAAVAAAGVVAGAWSPASAPAVLAAVALTLLGLITLDAFRRP